MTDDRSAVPGGPEELDTAATGIDTTVPHSARIWNYWLGGKDNFAVSIRKLREVLVVQSLFHVK